LSTPQTAGGGNAPIGRRISHLQQPSSQHIDPTAVQQGMPATTTTAAVQTTGSGNVRVVALNGSIGNGGRSVSKRAKPSSRCQFHQHFTSSFFVQDSFAQLFSTNSLALKFFAKIILAKKLLIKCWSN